MAIFYALCCLIFSAINDFVFKLYARRMRSRGMFVFWIGFCFLLAMLCLPRDSAASLSTSLFWGIISGTFSVVANILLIEAMGMQSAGLCSTIYRLNLVLVVPGAILLLGETLNIRQGLGILAALAAILAFMPGKEERGGQAGQKNRLGFYLVLLAAVLRAGMGLSYKYAFTHGADKNMVTVLNACMWIIGGMIYAALWEKNVAFKDKNTLKYGLLSGVFVSAIVFFMAGMLHLPGGHASIVLPIAQMSFLLTFIMGAVFLKEKISKRKVAALLCGCIAILLLVAK
jgi:drug/metabolite transporter (DMT)-like permease